VRLNKKFRKINKKLKLSHLLVTFLSLILILPLFYGVFVYHQKPVIAHDDCTWTTQTLDPNAGACSGGVCTCGNLTINTGQTVTVPSTVTSIYAILIIVNGKINF
jgi:hypothetical protein